MTYRKYCVVSAILFALIAIAHLLRIAGDITVFVDDYEVPMLVSWVALVVPGLLAVLGFHVSRG
jgi:hypothetical protein